MESFDAFSGKSTEAHAAFKRLPPVIPAKELHTLIGSVKELKTVTTYEEILDGLGLYIFKKNLFDKENNKVCCKGDDLSSVLGTEEFVLTDLNTLLPKLGAPVNNNLHNHSAEDASLQSGNSRKRKLEGSPDFDNRKTSAVNVSNSTSPVLLHIPPSPNYCDFSDSIDSIQGYETAYVKDTSDDFLSAENGEEKILAIEETYNIEYEVETDTSDYTLCDDYSSDSDVGELPENLEKKIVEFVADYFYKPKPDSDIEFFADGSSDDDDEQSDLEISEHDFWKCPKCLIKNKPTVRYCLKCFQQRKNWLPDKPANMKRKQRKPRASYRDTIELSEASLSKCDQDFQENNPGVLHEMKESSSESSPSMESAGPCNIELIDSPSMESIDSLCSVSTNSPCVESVHSILNIESVGCKMESSSSLYMESSGYSSMQSSGSSSMESSGPSSMESSGPSSMESSGPSSMESSGPSSMEFSNPCSMEASNISNPSSIKLSNLSSMEISNPSSMISKGPSNMESAGSSSMECISSSVVDKSVVENLCMFCCSEPVNASVIHGKFAHQISCYTCARKLKRGKKDCPICRRTIDRVVIQITM